MKNITEQLIPDSKSPYIRECRIADYEIVREGKASILVGAGMLAGKTRSEVFIKSDDLELVDLGLIKSGDLIIFTRGENMHDGSPNPEIINHLAFAYKINGVLNLFHTTRHFAYLHRADAKFSGVFYDEERHREQLGVSNLFKFAGDHTKIKCGDLYYFGYNDQLTSVADYAKNLFTGVSIFRPQSLF